MLDTSAVHEQSHEDRLQRVLAVYYGSLLHAHRCRSCGELCACTVVDCEARKYAAQDTTWECFRCRDQRLESSGEEVGGIE
jgi:hypothetical protein